ncbi:monooxygenase 2-like [Silene latifolia]|uniref:monooxygenase 2-like n=1 Tax=Silene latifolia TaxID=37657 RepID=UPI003D786624
METNAKIIIVGAGISGLATALALHRLGIKSLVLESSDKLRAAGIAFTTWTNAWRSLDALGIGQSLRQQHELLLGINTFSTVTGNLTSYVSFTTKGKHGDHEVRCVKRKVLLEALAKELPNGTIRYSSKVVSIQDSDFLKLVHLSDGSVLKAKVLIGCDGVNSVVAKSLGFKKPSLIGRSAIRGCAYYNQGHGFEPKFQLFVGNGVRYGIIPCDNSAVYWFFTWYPSSQEYKMVEGADQLKLKQFVLSKLGKVSDQIQGVIEDTGVEEIVYSPLGYRPPLQILTGDIYKDNVCVAGDACHPMTPDLGQGGCSALEDGVILAKCLANAFLEKSDHPTKGSSENEDDNVKIRSSLNDYAKKRRWRAFDLISTGYMLGFLQECNWFGMQFLREKVLSAFLAGFFLSKADVNPTELMLTA